MGDITPTVTIDEGWLLEDGMEGVNLFPYNAGSWDMTFPWPVVILSESDARWVFSTLTNKDDEIAFWKNNLDAEVHEHNNTINRHNNVVKQREWYRKVATYGIPASVITFFILGLIVGG